VSERPRCTWTAVAALSSSDSRFTQARSNCSSSLVAGGLRQDNRTGRDAGELHRSQISAIRWIALAGRSRKSMRGAWARLATLAELVFRRGSGVSAGYAIFCRPVTTDRANGPPLLVRFPVLLLLSGPRPTFGRSPFHFWSPGPP